MGCTEEDDKRGENATLYHYLDPEFGNSQCEFVLETAKGEVFAVERTSRLSPFVNTDGANGTQVRVVYKHLTNTIERCNHKEGPLKPPVRVVEITHIEKS